MHCIKLVPSLIGFMGVFVNSVTSLALKSAAFKVQSFASPTESTAAASYDPSNQVKFTNCESDQYQVYGQVNLMTITPCDRSDQSQPCTFVYGSKYTIELDFTTSLYSPHPRSSVIAYDKDGAYQYSGQSFNGCKYAVCPIRAEKPSSYVYHFQTLASPFYSLTFNVTQSFTGPSLFCANTDINFEEES